MPTANPKLNSSASAAYSSTSVSTSASVSQDGGVGSSGVGSSAGDGSGRSDAADPAVSPAAVSPAAPGPTTSATTTPADAAVTGETNSLIEFIALYGMDGSCFTHTTNVGDRASGGGALDDDGFGSGSAERLSDVAVQSSLRDGSKRHHRDGVWSRGKSLSGDSGESGDSKASRPTLHFSTWLGEPLDGRIIDTCPPLPNGTEEDEK